MALSRLKTTHRLGLGLLASLLVVSLIFVIPASVRAVNVSMPGLPTSMIAGSTYTFTAQVDIAEHEGIPITSLQINITGPNSAYATFTPNGTITSQSGQFTSIVPLVTPFYGYGYGYANGFFFGPGYGYGYGYYEDEETQLQYQVTFNATGLTAGIYTARLTVNAPPRTFQSSDYVVTVMASGTGSGGGGAVYTPPTAPPPPPPPPSGPGTTPPPTVPVPPLTGSGVIGGLAARDANGRTTASSTFTSTDGRISLAIPAGTKAVDSAGNLLTGISVTTQSTPPPPPANKNIVGLPYELGPTGATFDQPITLTFNYDPSTLPAGANENSLILAYFNTSTGQWVSLPTTVDPVTHKLTAQVTHFTTFAILASLPTTTPTPPVTPPTGGTTGGGEQGGTNWLLIAAIIVAVIIIVVILYFVWGRKRISG